MFLFFRSWGVGGKATSRYLAAQSQLESAKLAFHEVDKHIFEWSLGMQWLSQVCSSPLEPTAKTCKKCWMDQRKVMLDQLRWFMHRILPEMWPIVHFHSSASSLVTKNTSLNTSRSRRSRRSSCPGCTSWRNTKATSWTAASKPWSTCSTNSSRPRPTPSQVCCLRAWSFDPW